MEAVWPIDLPTFPTVCSFSFKSLFLQKYSWLSNCQRKTAGKYQSQMETKSDCISCYFRISWENAMRHSLENRMLRFPSSLYETVSKESLRLHGSIFREIMKRLTKYTREDHRNISTLSLTRSATILKLTECHIPPINKQKIIIRNCILHKENEHYFIDKITHYCSKVWGVLCSPKLHELV